MIQYWKRLAALGFLLFLALWIAGFVRTFAFPPTEVPAFPAPRLSSGYLSGEEAKSNRVSNNLQQIGLLQMPLPLVLDKADVNAIKVYEKTGQLSSGSTAFADDEARIYQAVQTHKADVFDQRATGIGPDRRLTLGIGVHPERFDALLQELKQVGQLQAITVEQKDRTAEFRKLHAQRQSLKQFQDDIVKVRENNKPSIEEAQKLAQKIHEINKEIEALNVQMGELLGKKPTYNLFITLQEYEAGSRQDRTLTVAKRLESGFLWAVGWWFVSVLGLALLVATYVSVQTLWPVRGARATTA